MALYCKLEKNFDPLQLHLPPNFSAALTSESKEISKQKTAAYRSPDCGTPPTLHTLPTFICLHHKAPSEKTYRSQNAGTKHYPYTVKFTIYNLETFQNNISKTTQKSKQ